MRVVNFLLATFVVASAFVIYELKYESRELKQRVAELKLAIRAERDAVAVLRAEWSHLNRPERIAKLARRHLGLKPLKAKQILTARQYDAIREPTPAEVAARMLGRDLPGNKRSASIH
ncbi:MAG: cell division protein FtsL [Hyphomicrobiaceae bacterium]|nr:cell division protein FtsL [Hyphomicrobiaceae bacterium]